MIAIVSEVIDLLFPRVCDVCGKLASTDVKASLNLKPIMSAEVYICGSCLARLVPQAPDKRWFYCLSEPYHGDPIPGQILYIAFPYDGPLKAAMPKIKFGRRRGLAELCGGFLGAFLAGDNAGADIVTSIPLSEQRLKERGFNQAGVMAEAAAKVMNLPYAGDILARKRNTSRQTELRTNEQRVNNIKGAFEVSEQWDVEGLTIILIDDVATTGNTMHEAALALIEAGADKVLCAALAGNRQVKNTESY